MARNILVKLTGDPEEAKAAVDEVVTDLKKLPAEVTTEIRVDAEQAKRNIDETIAKMESLPREETIHLRVQAESAKLDAFMAKLAALKAEAANTPVGQDLPATLTRNLATVSRQIDASRSRLEGMVADLDRLGQDGEKGAGRVTNAMTKLAGGLTAVRGKLAGLASDVVGKVPLLGGLFSGIVGTVGKLAEQLLPAAGQGFTGMLTAGLSLAALGPILLILVGAVAALVISIGQAVIGIVALGVGFLVALGPIIAVLGIVLIKIKDIVSAQQTLKTDAQNLKAAYDSQKQAITQLQQAEVNESRQRILALQAQRDAVLALKDAENQTADARLGVSSAALQVQQARITLAAFKRELAGIGQSPGDLLGKAQNVSVGGNLGQQQSGASALSYQQILLQYRQDILAVKVAEQQYRDSVQQVADATNNEGKAQVLVNQYRKEGLKANPAYLAADNARVTASQNLVRAVDQVHAALLAQRQAIKHGNAEAAGFISVWGRLKKAMGVVFGPAEKAVFKGIEQALVIISKHVGPLRGSFTILGKAIGDAFVWWAKMMTKPDNLALIKTLIKDAAGLVKEMSHWLGSGLKFLIIMGTSALPSLLKIIGHWAGLLSGINNQHNTIHDFIIKCVGQATTWWHRIQSIGGALLNVGKFLSSMIPLAEAVAAPFKVIEQGVNALQVIAHANAQAQAQGSTALKHTKAQIAKDEGILKGGNVTAKMRQFLLTQIRNLRGQEGSIRGNLPGAASDQFVNTLAGLVAGHASGGVTTGASLGMIGEAGPEAIIPLTGTVLGQLGARMAQYIVADFSGIMRQMPRSSPAVVAGRSPAGHGMHVENVNLHMNQGDTVTDDQHFAAVLEGRLRGLGGNIR